jgi:hypothetical protein
MNFSNSYVVGDIRTNVGSVEDVLYSQNGKYSSAFDVNGDGLGDNRDLFLLGGHLVANGASQAVLDSYTDLLLKRGDVNSSGATDAADMSALYGGFGPATWLLDLNVDGTVNIEDVKTMVTSVFRTVPGDFNLDGLVDGADYVVWRNNLGQTNAMFSQGDATYSGTVDMDDYAVWRSNFGFARQSLVAAASGAAAAVPEPTAIVLAGIMVLCGQGLRRKRK